MKTLIVVDFQKDFANSSGSLYVNGAEKAENAIVDYINDNALYLYEVIFTVDWHSPNHCSFKKNGGIWPVHCLQFSEGAGISDRIMQACVSHNLNIKVIKKGNCDDTEEYGAFQYMWKTTSQYMWKTTSVSYIKVSNEANQEQYLECSDLVVCGIAGDFCVKETLDNLLRHNKNEDLNLNIEVFRNGIASIDGGKILDEYIKENNLKTI